MDFIVAIGNSTTFLKVPMVIITVWEPSSLPVGGGGPWTVRGWKNGMRDA